MPSDLHTFSHAPILAVLLAASFGAHAQITAYKMRIPVGPLAAAAPAPVPGISVPGYDPATGAFQSAQGGFTWSGTTYGVTTGAAFGHTGPVTLTPAVTASAVKAAIRDSPESLAGTLVEGWLSGQGFSWDGAWRRVPPETDLAWLDRAYYASDSLSPACPDETAGCTAEVACTNVCYTGTVVWSGPGSVLLYIFDNNGSPVDLSCRCKKTIGSTAEWTRGVWGQLRATPYVAPLATQEDWDALPDPLPTVAPELPYAPYMLSGVAVQNNFTILDLDTNTTHNCTNGGCD